MKIGANDIAAVKIGSTDINKVYIGSNLVWEKASPVAYELYYDVNGLLVNVTNSFGTVDALGNISSFISTSPASGTDELSQGTLSSQPNLIVDHFGTGKNAILFNGTSDNLIKSNTSFTPDWDEEFYVAIKLQAPLTTFRCPFAVGQPVLKGGGPGFRFQISGTGQLQVVMVSGSGGTSSKVLATDLSYFNNTERNFIFHHKGVDEIVNDDIYLEGALVPTTVLADSSFIGKTMYSEPASINLRLGVRADGNGYYNGRIGKVILGLGTPNVEVITNSLNSAI